VVLGGVAAIFIAALIFGAGVLVGTEFDGHEGHHESGEFMHHGDEADSSQSDDGDQTDRRDSSEGSADQRDQGGSDEQGAGGSDDQSGSPRSTGAVPAPAPPSRQPTP
jgi:hypothetical protein